MSEVTLRVDGRVRAIHAGRFGDVVTEVGMSWEQAKELVLRVWNESEGYFGDKWFLDILRAEGYEVVVPDSEGCEK